MDRTGILFVCLGNICRSPLAKTVFVHQAKARGVFDRFDIDSCGLGSWHIGGPADPRTIDVAREYGLAVEHVARQFNPYEDPIRFPWIIAMDRQNVSGLLARGADPTRVRLMRSFDPTLAGKPDDLLEVPDPYTGGPEGFREIYRMIDRACAGLLVTLGK